MESTSCRLAGASIAGRIQVELASSIESETMYLAHSRNTLQIYSPRFWLNWTVYHMCEIVLRDTRILKRIEKFGHTGVSDFSPIFSQIVEHEGFDPFIPCSVVGPYHSKHYSKYTNTTTDAQPEFYERRFILSTTNAWLEFHQRCFIVNHWCLARMPLKVFYIVHKNKPQLSVRTSCSVRVHFFITNF